MPVVGTRRMIERYLARIRCSWSSQTVAADAAHCAPRTDYRVRTLRVVSDHEHRKIVIGSLNALSNTP